MWETITSCFEINAQTGTVDLNALVIIVLIVSGFLVGIINTIAGSGTVITYSLFMVFGLPATMANGTIRLGVILQTLAASATFKREGMLDVKRGLWFAGPVVVGTIIGAQIATQIHQNVFEKVLAVAMLIMLAFIFIDPKKWIQGQLHKVNKRITLKQGVIFFGVGLYGGFIHIGVGLFLIAILVMNAGYDLVKANALKVFIVLIYSPIALFIFILHGQVDYRFGLISAFGNLLGGIVASHMAIKRGAGFVRWFLVAIILLYSFKLLFN